MFDRVEDLFESSTRPATMFFVACGLRVLAATALLLSHSTFEVPFANAAELKPMDATAMIVTSFFIVYSFVTPRTNLFIQLNYAGGVPRLVTGKIDLGSGVSRS